MKVREFVEKHRRKLDAMKRDGWDVSDFEQALSIIEAERAALNEIASWKEGPIVNSSFDEPGSAQIARRALAREVTG
jgi:hypothetical protein